MVKMPQMLGQSDSGSVILKAVKLTPATGIAALQQRVERDWHTASHTNVENVC